MRKQRHKQVISTAQGHSRTGTSPPGPCGLQSHGSLPWSCPPSSPSPETPPPAPPSAGLCPPSLGGAGRAHRRQSGAHPPCQPPLSHQGRERPLTDDGCVVRLFSEAEFPQLFLKLWVHFAHHQGVRLPGTPQEVSWSGLSLAAPSLHPKLPWCTKAEGRARQPAQLRL